MAAPRGHTHTQHTGRTRCSAAGLPIRIRPSGPRRPTSTAPASLSDCREGYKQPAGIRTHAPMAQGRGPALSRRPRPRSHGRHGMAPGYRPLSGMPHGPRETRRAERPTGPLAPSGSAVDDRLRADDKPSVGRPTSFWTSPRYAMPEASVSPTREDGSCLLSTVRSIATLP